MFPGKCIMILFYFMHLYNVDVSAYYWFLFLCRNLVNGFIADALNLSNSKY